MELLAAKTEQEAIEQDVKQEIGDTVETARAMALRIKDDETRAGAIDFGSLIQGKINKVKGKREDVVPQLRRAYEKVRSFFDDALAPLEAAKRTLAQAISAYDIEVERKQRIEQEERDRKAREERAAYEKKKAAWQLEQDHTDALADHVRWECSEAAEAFRKRREAKIRAEEDARVEHAEEAEKQGNVGKVERILEKTTAIAPEVPQMPQVRSEPSKATMPPPPLPPPAPAPVIVARRPDENVIARDIWQWEGGDLRALAQAIVERRAPLEYIAFNNGVIGKDVRKLKDEFRCDGLRTWKERSTSFRAGD